MRYPLFVFLGAALWATDTLFRQPMTEELSSVTIVFFEHAFAVLYSLAWLLTTAPSGLIPGFSVLQGSFFIGVLGSAGATLLFTESFSYVNPTVSILIQKIQPLIVISLSSAFLGEKLSRGFLFFGSLALISAFFLSFPAGIPVGAALLSGRNLGGLFALLAAILWAVSTLIGKHTLRNTTDASLSFWRFFSGLAALWIISRKFSQARIEIPFVLSEPRALKTFALMALIPGFLGVLLYYRGLRRVPASVATLLELSFPLTAIWVNSRFLGFHLERNQWIAAAFLLTSMVGVSLSSRKRG